MLLVGCQICYYFLRLLFTCSSFTMRKNEIDSPVSTTERSSSMILKKAAEYP
jgi:hypothetical protein